MSKCSGGNATSFSGEETPRLLRFSTGPYDDCAKLSMVLIKSMIWQVGNRINAHIGHIYGKDMEEDDYYVYKQDESGTTLSPLISLDQLPFFLHPSQILHAMAITATSD